MRRLKIAICATGLALGACLTSAAICLPSAAVTYAETPISGVVSCDGRPLAGALVTFSSVDSPCILLGVTGEAGRYRLHRATGSESMQHGFYRVTISKFARLNGEPTRPDEPPMRSGSVRELAAARFSLASESALSAEVGPEGGEFDFAISGR